jgi:hypothetical protein
MNRDGEPSRPMWNGRFFFCFQKIKMKTKRKNRAGLLKTVQQNRKNIARLGNSTPETSAGSFAEHFAKEKQGPLGAKKSNYAVPAKYSNPFWIESTKGTVIFIMNFLTIPETGVQNESKS